MTKEQQQLLKENVLELVKHHRAHCHDPDCRVSLCLVRVLVEEVGTPLTDDEKMYFL